MASQPARRPIAEAQNSHDNLVLIRAFKWHYRTAKRWHAARVTGTVLLALAGPVILFWSPTWGDWIGAVAGMWVLIGRTVLARFEDRDVKIAATIQEQFDVDVFDLAWNDSLVGARVSPEDIHTAASKIASVDEINRLRDWYADADQASWPLNVVLCQRSSAVWGRRNHTWYARNLMALGFAWLLAGIVMGAAAHATVGDYLIRVFLPSQPAFLDAIDLVRAHQQMADAKEMLAQAITDLWNRGATEGSVTAADCRHVQDEAFRLRRRGVQVPEIVYRLHRARDQAAMEAAVADLLGRAAKT